MTNAKEVDSAPGPLDTALLVAASLAVVAGIVAYYYFENTVLVLRVLAVLGGVAIGAGLVYQTHQGKTLWRFVQGSRIEIRKVIWPTRQETMQTTLSVFFFVLVLGVFFWGLDFLLLMISRAVTGHGG